MELQHNNIPMPSHDKYEQAHEDCASYDITTHWSTKPESEVELLTRQRRNRQRRARATAAAVVSCRHAR